MSFEFTKMKLIDVTSKIGSGSTPRGGKEAYQQEGISLIRSQNIHDFRFSYDGLAFIDEQQAYNLRIVEVKENDVLLNITGDSVARCCMPDKYALPARVNQHVAIIRTNLKIANPFYIMYSLLNPITKKYLLSLASNGGTRNALTKSMIENLDLPIPDITLQNKIAAILSALDDKIELNNRKNKVLEQLAQTIFKQWFVAFEFPNEKGEPYKSSCGEMEWCEELGKEIPKGWKVSKLKEECELITKGTTPTTLGKTFSNSGINFIKAESITNNHSFNSNKFAFIDKETNILLKRSIIKKDDILFTIAGTLGRFAIASGEQLPANTNQAVCIIRAKKTIISPHFIFCYFLTGEQNEYFISRTQQAVQANLSLTTIGEMPLIIPSAEHIKQFNQTFGDLLTKKNLINKENSVLSNIRDTLLPKLMSGEIEVSNLEL